MGVSQMTNVSTLFDVLSVEQIAEIQATNLPAPEHIVEGTAENIRKMREEAMASGRLQPPKFVRMHKEGLIELFGIRQVKRDENGTPLEIADWRIGKEGWVAEWNAHNRGILDSNRDRLIHEVSHNRFVTTPETWIFLSDGQCGSAQHRGFAIFLEQKTRPDYAPVVLLCFGFSAAFADVLDRAAKRSNKDIGERNDVIPSELLVDSDGHPLEGAANLVRTLNRELNTALKIVWMRAQAKDIKASVVFQQHEYGRMLGRCPGAAELLVRLAVLGRDSEGKDTKLVKMFGRANIAAALILASNTENESDVIVHEGKRIFTLPDVIEMPSDELVESVMSIGSRGMISDPYGHVYDGWSRVTNKHPQRKFGVLVNLIRETMGACEQVEIPPATDPQTGQPLPGATSRIQWQCPVIDFKQVDVPVPAVRKPGQDAPPAYQWTYFGGLDTGYLPRPTKD